MRKTNDEIDTLIGEQQSLIASDAGRVNVQRGHISTALGQLVKNRAEAVCALESQKEASTVTLRAGI